MAFASLGGSPRLLVGSGRTSEVPPLILRAQHPLVPRRTRRAEPVPDHPHHTPRPSGATRDGTRPPPPKPSSGTVASEGGDPTLGDGPRGPPAPARPRATGTSVRTRWAGSGVPRGGRPHRRSPRRPHVGCPRRLRPDPGNSLRPPGPAARRPPQIHPDGSHRSGVRRNRRGRGSEGRTGAGPGAHVTWEGRGPAHT